MYLSLIAFPWSEKSVNLLTGPGLEDGHWGKGPFNSQILICNLMDLIGPHPPTHPLMDHLTLRFPLNPTPPPYAKWTMDPADPLNGPVQENRV